MSIKANKNGKEYPLGFIPQHYPADRVYLDGDINKTVQDAMQVKIASNWNEALTNAKEYIAFHAIVLIDTYNMDYKGISLQISVPVLKVSPNTYWGESDMYDHGDNYHLQVKIDNHGTTVSSYGLYKDNVQVTTDVTFYICYK
jgi:hypothetical protein